MSVNEGNTPAGAGDSSPPRERIDSLDLIRGVAILGILFMNIVSMAAPEYAYFSPIWYSGAGIGERIVYAIQSLFIESRFYTLFSLLFGVGLAIQTDSFAGKGLEPKRWIRRRLLVLLGFGLLHGFLIWYGDILTLYAVTGLLVVHWVHWPRRRMIVVGVVLVLLGQLALLSAFFASLASGANIMEVPDLPFSEAVLVRLRDSWTSWSTRLPENTGSFLDTLVAIPITQFWHTAGLMLFGMALYRSGFFTNPRAWRWGIPLIVAGIVASGAILRLRYVFGTDSSAAFSTISMMMIPGLFMAIGYASLMIPIAGGDGPIRRALRNTGKTAFTLYLGQSVVMVGLFTLVMPAQWGDLGRPQLWAIVAAYTVVQIIAADFWQRRVGQGPLERLWRRLAYRRGR